MLRKIAMVTRLFRGESLESTRTSVRPCFGTVAFNSGRDSGPGEFFQIMSAHGMWLTADVTSGEVMSCHENSMQFGRSRLIAYVSALRPDACFLIANPVGSRRLIIHPGLDCEAILPLGLSRSYTTATVFLYHPGTSQWLCAPPIDGDADSGVVEANREKIGAWEVFTLVPYPSTFVDSETLSLTSRLDTLLRQPLSADIVLSLSVQEAPILQAVARMMPYASLDQFARALLMSPEACRKLAQLFPHDMLGTFGLPALSAWVSGSRKPTPKTITVNTELDLLPPLEGMLLERHASFPSVCTALARRAVEPRRDVCIIATARNEGLYLLEWIAYHRAIGIETFFLYTNDNDDGSDDLLRALARAGAIHWADNKVPLGGNAQGKAYAHALAIQPDVLDYRWALIIDLDEYFVLNPARFRSIIDYLHWQETKAVDAIALNWIIHGSSGSANWRDDFVVRRFPSPIAGPDVHIKTLFRPRKFIYSHPHNPLNYRFEPFIFKNSSGGLHVPSDGPYGSAMSKDPIAEYAWINHYLFKSSEEFLLKLSRNRGDRPTVNTNTILDASFLPGFMSQFSTMGKAQADPEDAAPAYESELASLMRLPGVADAFDQVKFHYARWIKEVLPILIQSPAFIETGSVGKAFLDTLGLSGD